MKIYLVEYDRYESSYPTGVFSSQQKAEEYISSRPEDEQIYFDISEWVIDRKND